MNEKEIDTKHDFKYHKSYLGYSSKLWSELMKRNSHEETIPQKQMTAGN